MADGLESGAAERACAFPRDRGNGPYRLLRGAHDDLVRDFLWALDHPREAQERRAARILDLVRDSALGRSLGLASARTLDDLRRAAPVADPEELRPWLDRVAAGERGVLSSEPVLQLLETSGTTGAPKHLPATPAWAASVARAQKLWVLALARDHEAATRGRALTVVSAAEHARSPGGLPIGSNTGRMLRAQPWWLRFRYAVPYPVFTLPDQRVRQYAILRFALQAPVTSWTTANPSTVLLLARRLREWREPLAWDLRRGTLRAGPAADLDRGTRRRLEWRLRRRPEPADWRPARLWPLAVVNCWKGGPAGYFVDRLPEALGARVPVREVGITSSEGYFAVPLADDWPGGVLWTLGHVLEFIDEAGEARWAWELETGRRYRLVITTEAGLLRYDLADEVEVVGWCRRTPLVRFAGKAGRFLNAVGERVSEAQVAAAMRAAAGVSGEAPAGFTVRLRMAEVPRYEVAVEGTPATEALAAAFDRALAERNVEYAGKRASGRLGPPAARALPRGTYGRWRAARVAAGAPEWQLKDPVIAVDEAEWARILAAAGEGT